MISGNLQLHIEKLKWGRRRMTTTTGTWWESIFSGPLAHGVCEEKLMLLQDEAFLYLSTTPLEKKEEPEIN